MVTDLGCLSFLGISGRICKLLSSENFFFLVHHFMWLNVAKEMRVAVLSWIFRNFLMKIRFCFIMR